MIALLEQPNIRNQIPPLSLDAYHLIPKLFQEKISCHVKTSIIKQ